MHYEAYSWGVGEDESGDGLYCGFEGVVGAAVIGVQDTPSFDIRDDTFDEVADTVDGRVVSPVGVGEFTMGGFPGGGDHSQSDVAFVSTMTLTVEGCEEAGFFDGLRIMHITRQGWGDPGELSGQGAGHTCRFTPVVWCLPEYSSGCSCHDQQDTKGAVDDVLADLGQGSSKPGTQAWRASAIKGV